jgi:hypothetical protein
MRLSAWATSLYAVLRVVIWATLLLIFFAAMTWLIALILAWWFDTPVAESRNIELGIICGLVAWLFLAAFHLRTETLTLPFTGREVFLHRVKTVLRELGYEVMIQTPTHARFHPSFGAFLMGGGIVVRVDDGTAAVTGPRLSLEMLRRRLRLYQRLAAVHQSAGECRRPPDHRLKRVHITVRLPADRWPEVMDRLLGAVGPHASMIVDLHILAQSSGELRDSTIEQVRAWLHERGIAVEIRKDHVQLPEPGAATLIDEEIRV